jgi:two-component system, NarL family, invasion response regulator UvrY
MLRLLIADDHAIIRRGLKDIILEAYPTAEIKEAGDAEELIKIVMKENWNIVITDMSMPGRSGLEALQQIKLHNANLPVLVLSVHPEEQYAVRVLKAGAAGYLNKEMAPEELVKAVRTVLSGKKYITQSVAENLANVVDLYSQKRLHENLSDREFEVFKLLAAGKSISEIGTILLLSVTTVSTYRSRILTKMNMKTNSSLTQYAFENKLI